MRGLGSAISMCALAVWPFLCAASVATTMSPGVIAPLHGDTAIETYGGVEVWSDYVAANRSWVLMVRRGNQISTLSIPPAKSAIEVDVGPGPSGSPMLAYTECASSCHVVVSGVDGSHPEVVPDSQGASHPTIWGDRVAWVSGKTKVMISRLDGTERRVLAGAPARKCYYTGYYSARVVPRLVCKAPRDPSVEALQLYRGQLALIDTFILNDEIGSVGTTTEVRTEAVTGGPQRLIGIIDVGEGDESWLGPSWSGGKLYFYEDSMGAGFKVYRFDPAGDTYASAPAHTFLTGFSVIGDRAYEATAGGEPTAGGACTYEEEPCVVRMSEPFTFKPISAKSLVFIP